MVISILLCNDIFVPCFAHTLSLAVKDAILKKFYFSAISTKCRDIIVTYFHQSNAVNLKLIDLYTEERCTLQQDVSTRWNSTYATIKSLLIF